MFEKLEHVRTGDAVLADHHNALVDAARALVQSTGDDVFVDATGIHVRRRPGLALSRFKVDSARSRGAVYKGYHWNRPAAAADRILNMGTSAAITAAQLGTQGEEVHLINPAELTLNTHDLNAVYVWAFPSPDFSASDGKPVYEIVGFAFATEDCTVP